MFKNNIMNNIKNIDFKKINIKKIVLSCFLALVLVVQITFLKFLFSGITPDDKKTDENVIMSYNSNGKFDYKVYLKPNEFINKEYLDEGEAYILDLIDHININSFYNFSSTEKTSVSGNNKITAKLVVNYRDSSESNGNPELLSKEKVLDEKVITFDNVSYSTSGNYDLYLDEYLKVLRDFQSKVKISVEGYVEILSETKINGKIGGASYNDSYSNKLKVPLSSSVIKISNSKGKEKTSKVYEGDLVKTNKKVMSFIVIGNIITFLILCVLSKMLFTFNTKSEYEKVLNKLLKTYDDIIVNTSNILDVSNYKIIEITEFKEMLNLSRELLLPIMNYEVMKDKETWFYVIKDDILYRYVVLADKLEEDKLNKKKKFKLSQ